MTPPRLLSRRSLLTGLALLWTGLAAKAEETTADALPRVLILGDSISMGYTPFVQKGLEGEAVVIRANRDGKAENCQGTTYGLQHLDRWLQLGGGAWDVIHVNFGLHDLKHVDPETGKNSNDPEHPRQAEPEVYAKQLAAIVAKLEASGAKLIFATTTPFPSGVRPYRDPADAARYNTLAREIMQAHGVVINDLHAFAKPRLDEIQQPVNVHFTNEGSKALAGEVLRHLREALASE